MSRFFGIRREPVFSPGKVEDDAAILEAVAAQLRQRGHHVTVFSADEPQWPEPRDVALVFTMCQGAAALDRLQVWHARGVRIINSPDGILNCQRHRTIPVLAQSEVPFPTSIVAKTSNGEVPAWVSTRGAWIKRGDVHATEAADVIRVDSRDAAGAALRALRERNIQTAVIQQHAAGTVVKFYAVRQRFFRCVLPPDGGRLSADVVTRIDLMSQRAAQALDVEVYGGDCVYDGDGTLSLIDLNDWPSYASCRAEAATEIAAYLHAREVASRR